MAILPFVFHSSVDRHLGYFNLLATVNNGFMNIHKQVFVRTYAYICIYPRVYKGVYV